LLLTVGTFPLIAAQELATMSGRPVSRVRKRLCQFEADGAMTRIDGTHERLTYFQEIECAQCHHLNQIAKSSGKRRFGPSFWYLRPAGARQVKSLMGNIVAWSDKSANIVDHDRGITLCHLSFHNAFRDGLSDWRQQRDEVKETVLLDGETVHFYADAKFQLAETMYYLEYQHSSPSSKNGETDLDVKVARYNALLKGRKDAKGIFVFRERNHVENFLKRIADDYPYRWLWATHMEAIKHKPAGQIFWCPKDYEERTYSFQEEAVK
jgi:hypothetical protein